MVLFRNLGALSLFFCALAAPLAGATPSTQIWIPSTDIQKFEVVHLNYDTYARPGKISMLVLGPTVGIAPWQKFQAEVGLDLMFQGSRQLDTYPLYVNAKVGTPEDSLFKYQPAVAVGVYNAGIRAGLTNQNVTYGLLARTLPWVGRISAGYYFGNPTVLVDGDGARANNGPLLSWDRTMTEVSKRLWLAVDYQGGRSALGALNAGAAWSFTDAISMIVGYDHYLDPAVSGKDTFTLQLDVNVGQ